MSEVVPETVITNCPSVPITQAAYTRLRDARSHGRGNPPCLRDDCPLCAPLNALIDATGAECEARGCTLTACLLDQ